MFVFYLSLLLAVIPTRNDGALPFTKTPPSTIYFMEGSDAVFVWEFYVDKKPADFLLVSWNIFNETRKDFVTMLQEDVSGKLEESRNLAPAYKGRIEKKDQATLVVKKVTPEDAVSFRCILADNTGLLTKSTVKLVVTGQATALQRIQFGNVGDTVTFTCNVSGVPSENITWTRQLTAEKIANSSQYLITSHGIGSSQLTIRDMTIDDQAGYYVCDGTVNVDQPNSATCYLQVQFLKSEGPYDVTICGSQTITCPVTGYSPPIVTWENNGNQLQKGENTSLSITSMMDSGIYTCTATNVVSSVGPINIGVVKKCVNLSLSCIDGTAEQPAKLNWSPPVGAKYYVVDIAGGDVLDDRNLVIGATTSLEIHYLTLVMKKADEKPKETEIRVQVSAMDDQRVLVKAACEKLSKLI